ncbi:unnamed protein product, partial [Symbiodinium sp. CCMP2456]
MSVGECFAHPKARCVPVEISVPDCSLASEVISVGYKISCHVTVQDWRTLALIWYRLAVVRLYPFNLNLYGPLVNLRPSHVFNGSKHDVHGRLRLTILSRLDGDIPVDRDEASVSLAARQPTLQAFEDGVLFLDRDPDLFDWVLRFARTGEIQKDMPGALKAEFDFLLLSWPPCCQRCGVYFDTARNSDTSCRHHRFPWLEDVEISREDRTCCPWPERSEKGCCKNCGTEICGRQVFKSYVRRYICCKGRIDEPGCRRCRHELPPDADPSLEEPAGENDNSHRSVPAEEGVLGGLAFVLVALLGPVAPSSVRAEEVEAVEVQDPAQKKKEEQERRKAEAKAKREEEEQRRKEVAEKRQAEAQKAREEAEAKRKAQAEEAAKKKEEAEKARAEEAAKRKAEEEQKKQEQEAKRQEEAKKREEAEKARAEEAAKRKAEEAEKKKEAEARGQ